MTTEAKQVAAPDVSWPARVARTLDWRFREATSRWRSLPDFIVIGAQRAGTTSLFDALAAHAQILPSFRKEVHYFELHHRRGVDWYRANFPLVRQKAGERITGEATPNYLAHPLVPERVASDAPEAKLVVLLRNPVERTHSSWRLRVFEGLETRGFGEAIHEEAESGDVATELLERTAAGRPQEAMRYAYLQKSRYAEHLTRWLAHFPREQFHIVQSETLFAVPSETLSEMLAFLGVDPGQPPALDWANAATVADIEPADRAWLTEYFAPHNAELEAITGLTFAWD